MAFDLKVINSVLGELSETRGISPERTLEAIEAALATAYKKEFGKRGQIVRAQFDTNTGTVVFEQVKIVVDETTVRFDEDEEEKQEEETATDEKKPTKKENSSDATVGTPTSPTEMSENVGDEDEKLPLFNPEQHILISDAQRIKKEVALDDEMVFPLETKEDFGRIAAQTAKQVIMQKIREAEKEHLSREFGEREGEIISGTVQRIERGNIFVDLGRATGMLPYDEQIPGERYRQGERLRAYLYRVEETPKGVFLRLSRSHPSFLLELFESESPEIAQGVVEIRAIAREAGSRSKVAVWSNDEHIDPVGALVGQRGVRVSTVMSELGGEKIDVVEWSENPEHFVEDALSPAKVLDVEITDEERHIAVVTVSTDQLSLAIGRGGQNVRLAAKLTGWKIDIQAHGEEETETDAESADEVPSSDEKEGVKQDGNETIAEDAHTDAETDAPTENSESEEKEVEKEIEASLDETADEEKQKSE